MLVHAPEYRAAMWRLFKSEADALMGSAARGYAYVPSSDTLYGALGNDPASREDRSAAGGWLVANLHPKTRLDFWQDRFDVEPLRLLCSNAALCARDRKLDQQLASLADSDALEASGQFLFEALYEKNGLASLCHMSRLSPAIVDVAARAFLYKYELSGNFDEAVRGTFTPAERKQLGIPKKDLYRLCAKFEQLMRHIPLTEINFIPRPTQWQRGLQACENAKNAIKEQSEVIGGTVAAFGVGATALYLNQNPQPLNRVAEILTDKVQQIRYEDRARQREADQAGVMRWEEFAHIKPIPQKQETPDILAAKRACPADATRRKTVQQVDSWEHRVTTVSATPADRKR